MQAGISGHLFISYAHADEPLMLVFRKHLRGMLADKFNVWSDHDILQGSTWQSFLQDNLNQANSALLLASPDYLVSSWCRAELVQLAEAKRSGRLRQLFWVQLIPCGWQHSELRDIQGFASEQAINEFADDTARQRAILQACERIATELVRSANDSDRALMFVRRLLADTGRHNLTVDRVLRDTPFSIVCHGFNGSNNVAVKVLKFVPIKGLMESLRRIGEQRARLTDPTFYRLHEIFQSDSNGERRTIFVSEFIDNAGPLSDAFQAASDDPKYLSVDRVGRMLRRMATGLSELHSADLAGSEWERTLGLLTPEDVYYHPSAVRMTVAPIGISSFLWHILDFENYIAWVDQKSEVYVTPEQHPESNAYKARRGVTTLTDQYVLGRLGLEMLEHRSFADILNGRKVEVFWREPEECMGDWKDHHTQLRTILKQLLQDDPKDRFENMKVVVERLEGLEEEARALAKSVYLPPPDKKKPPVFGTALPDEKRLPKLDPAFFKDFYETFLANSSESKERFSLIPLEEQQEKLQKAMEAVLNFRRGNVPTSLDQFLTKHKGIKKAEFDEFQRSFLATLAKHDFKPAVQEAWKKILAPAIEYMKLNCAIDGKSIGSPEAADTTLDRNRLSADSGRLGGG
jgi:hypothetical protein